MDFVLRSKKVKGFLIDIRQEKFSDSFAVAMYKMHDECSCGYPVSERYYPTMQKANARFNYLKRGVERGLY